MTLHLYREDLNITHLGHCWHHSCLKRSRPPTDFRLPPQNVKRNCNQVFMMRKLRLSIFSLAGLLLMDACSHAALATTAVVPRDDEMVVGSRALGISGFLFSNLWVTPMTEPNNLDLLGQVEIYVIRLFGLLMLLLALAAAALDALKAAVQAWHMLKTQSLATLPTNTTSRLPRPGKQRRRHRSNHRRRSRRSRSYAHEGK